MNFIEKNKVQNFIWYQEYDHNQYLQMYIIYVSTIKYLYNFIRVEKIYSENNHKAQIITTVNRFQARCKQEFDT